MKILIVPTALAAFFAIQMPANAAHMPCDYGWEWLNTICRLDGENHGADRDNRSSGPSDQKSNDRDPGQDTGHTGGNGGNGNDSHDSHDSHDPGDKSNRSGHADGTNPGGQDNNSGRDNPGRGNGRGGKGK